MKQLRYLIPVSLYVSENIRQPNGAVTATFQKTGDYQIQLQELTDQISANIYGARVNRMYRISSPHFVLESDLYEKVNTSPDNVSLYTVLLNGARYKIVAVRKNWVDIELL